MRIVFMGTPDFAVPTLDALVAAGHEIAAVYCQPPRPAGRGKTLRPSPVQQRAEALGIAVATPTSLRDADAQAAFAALDTDIAVVAAYGLILPQPILDAPRMGCLNVHASLLPRWRGAAPIQRAIMAGDEETGVTIMRMERGLDTGPTLLEERTLIGRKTAGELTKELSAMGARLMVEVLAQPNSYPPVPQSEDGVLYAPKIHKSETRIDFFTSSDDVIWHVQGLSPTPGAWIEVCGERIKVLRAEDAPVRPTLHGTVLDNHLTVACALGSVRLTLLQRAGRGVMTTAELLRGFPIPAGTRLT